MLSEGAGGRMSGESTLVQATATASLELFFSASDASYGWYCWSSERTESFVHRTVA